MLQGGTANPVQAVLETKKAPEVTTEPGPDPNGELQYFADNQFQELYERLAHPNTQEQTTPPEITGNDAADARIRTIAESRGYRLRRVPVLAIEKTNEKGLIDDDLLQPYALEGWQKLKEAAGKDGVPLNLSSGYRSIAFQRDFFMQKLRGSGASVAAIAGGQADGAVVSIISSVAPPGYSRHHNGYTMDFTCGDGNTTFKYTVCFRWLKEDNYRRTKDTGIIPSYPEEADQQGPEPEAWEYVWVGRANLVKR